MFSSGQRPRPAVCRSCRFSAAIRQWGLSGHCEIKFYRPEEGRKVTELESLTLKKEGFEKYRKTLKNCFKE